MRSAPMVLMSALLLASGLFFVFALHAVHRNCILTAYSGILTVVYAGDALFTAALSTLTFSRRFSGIPYTDRGFSFALIMFAVCLVSAQALGCMLPVRRARFPHSGRIDVVARPLPLSALILPVAFAVPVIALLLREGVENVLLNRQLYFGNNALLTFGYYAVPAGCVLAVFAARRERTRVRRGLFVTLSVMLLAVSAATGSRSSVVLSIVLPLTHWYLVSGSSPDRATSRAGSLRSGRVRRVVAFGLIASAVVVFAAVSLSVTRGSGTGRYVFDGPDVTQFDATVLILDHRSELVANGFMLTYLSPLFLAVPSSVLPERPMSASALISERLFPSRYSSTRSETTASLLGEAALNVGLLGGVSAGLMVGVFCVWMAHGGPSVGDRDLNSLLVVVFAYRGLNLIRGDVFSAVVPLGLTYLVFWLAARTRRELGRERPSEGGRTVVASE